MMKRFLLKIIIILIAGFAGKQPVFAQTNTDKLLASQYFQNNEFDKAAVLYEKLFSQTHLDFYYNYYLACLLNLKDFKTAEKTVRKQIKNNPEALRYIVDLGFVYQSSGETGKSSQEYERALKALQPDQKITQELAGAFIKRGKDDYAIQTYLKGRKILKGEYYFFFEIAAIYYRNNKINDMIGEYLELLEKDATYLEQVQNLLQGTFFDNPDEKKNEALKNLILKYIQKFPEKQVFTEMLTWYFIQVKDFNSAFIQAKALDKRLDEGGARLITLAGICTENENYEIAVRCLEYVIMINKDLKGFSYFNARMQILQVMSKKITTTSYSHEDLAELEKSYNDAIDEMGRNARTVILLKELAHLQAFYLYKTDAAIEALEQALKIPQAKQNELAECKLELADILLLTGEVWDASLYYSQVEKAFKQDPIGHEAKFRNARLAYFKGEFMWAQAQLDVLKASTSKLIANDALELALLISDNTALDTSTEALLIYSHADMLEFQNKDEESLTTLDSILSMFPEHPIKDEVYYKKARIFIRKEQYDLAVEMLNKIVSDHYFDILADNALFELAMLYEKRLGDENKAMEFYQRLMTDFSGSLLVMEARKRFRKLRGDKVN